MTRHLECVLDVTTVCTFFIVHGFLRNKPLITALPASLRGVCKVPQVVRALLHSRYPHVLQAHLGVLHLQLVYTRATARRVSSVSNYSHDVVLRTFSDGNRWSLSMDKYIQCNGRPVHPMDTQAHQHQGIRVPLPMPTSQSTRGYTACLQQDILYSVYSSFIRILCVSSMSFESLSLYVATIQQ